MTTIAYRDGVLATDSRVTSGDVIIGEVRKIAASGDGRIAAVCGVAEVCQEWLSWWAGPQDADPPELDEDTGVITVEDDGVWYHTDRGRWQLEAEYHAVGSGRDIALGAMAVGACAVEAIEAAIKHDAMTGGRVQSLRAKRKPA